MKELEVLKPLLKEYDFFLEISYRHDRFFMILCRDTDNDKSDFLTLYDRPVEEMVEFIESNIVDLSIEASLGRGPFSWPSKEERLEIKEDK